MLLSWRVLGNNALYMLVGFLCLFWRKYAEEENESAPVGKHFQERYNLAALMFLFLFLDDLLRRIEGGLGGILAVLWKIWRRRFLVGRGSCVASIMSNLFKHSPTLFRGNRVATIILTLRDTRYRLLGILRHSSTEQQV